MSFGEEDSIGADGGCSAGRSGSTGSGWGRRRWSPPAPSVRGRSGGVDEDSDINSEKRGDLRGSEEGERGMKKSCAVRCGAQSMLFL